MTYFICRLWCSGYPMSWSYKKVGWLILYLLLSPNFCMPSIIAVLPSYISRGTNFGIVENCLVVHIKYKFYHWAEDASFVEACCNFQELWTVEVSCDREVIIYNAQLSAYIDRKYCSSFSVLHLNLEMSCQIDGRAWDLLLGNAEMCLKFTHIFFSEL